MFAADRSTTGCDLSPCKNPWRCRASTDFDFVLDPKTSRLMLQDGMSDAGVQRERRKNVAKPQQDVTDAELAVLQHLWARQTATIRGITDDLYPGGGSSHYATVQKLLERLEGKGHVTRNAAAVPHRFA